MLWLRRDRLWHCNIRLRLHFCYHSSMNKNFVHLYLFTTLNPLKQIIITIKIDNPCKNFYTAISQFTRTHTRKTRIPETLSLVKVGIIVVFIYGYHRLSYFRFPTANRNRYHTQERDTMINLFAEKRQHIYDREIQTLFQL